MVRYLTLRPGEKLIDQLDSVEDTKGNNGERGTLYVIKYSYGSVFQVVLKWTEVKCNCSDTTWTAQTSTRKRRDDKVGISVNTSFMPLAVISSMKLHICFDLHIVDVCNDIRL